MTLRRLWLQLKHSVIPYHEIKRPSFPVDDRLERAAHAARIAMGTDSLLAVPVTRKQPPRREVDFEDLPV